METLLEKIIGLDFKIKGSGSRWMNTEEHSSLVLDIQEQVWYWNSRDMCGKPIDYLTRVKNLSPEDAKKLINEINYIPFSISPPKKGEKVVQNDKLIDIFWRNGQNDRDYWYRRCLTDQTIDTYRLGKYDGLFTLPIFVDGNFLNFQCRADTPKKKILPWYRGVGPLLYNSSILPFISTVFITEGPVDAILLNQNGFPAVSHSGGAQGWQNKWFPYFRNQKIIYCVADNDLAGYTAVDSIAKSLGESRVRIISFLDFSLKYDTVDFFRDGGTKDEFKQLVTKASESRKAKEYCDYIKKKYPTETI